MSKSNVQVDSSSNSVSVALDQQLYPLDSIYGASYTFIDRGYVKLDKDDKDNVTVTITGKDATDDDALFALGGEFLNELLNETLRLKISQNNKTIREMLINKALYATLPHEQAPPADDFDDDFLDEDLEFLDDPLGIAVPWEDKYAQKDEAKSEPAETTAPEGQA